MAGDRGETKFRYTLKSDQGSEAFSQKTVRTFPISQWKIYLILAPVFFAAAFLSILFFSILLPLILGIGLSLGVWVWWVRRKLRNTLQSEDLHSDYTVINETRIVDADSAEKGGD